MTLKTQITWPDDVLADLHQARINIVAAKGLSALTYLDSAIEALSQPSPLGKCLEALEATHLAIKAARNMVPDEDEGLASQVFAYHLNAADMGIISLLAQIGKVQKDD